MIKQHTDKWYKIKASTFGATDAACILGHGYNTRDEIIYNKIHRIDSRKLSNNLPQETLLLMARGNRYEPIVNDLYSKQHCIVLQETGLKYHPNLIFQTASPDGLISNTNKFHLMEFKVKRSLSESIPYKHWIQMQMQMAVYGIDKCMYSQNVIHEFPDYTTYVNEINKFSGVNNSHGVHIWEGNKYYWRLDEYSEKLINYDSVFFKQAEPILRDAWNEVELGRKSLLQTSSKHGPDESVFSLHKKRRVSEVASRLIVSPHMLTNWFRQDTLLDWLDLYGSTDKKSLEPNPFIDMLRIKNYEFASITKTFM